MNEINITQVQFLVPIRITYTQNGTTMIAEGTANLATKEVFLEQGHSSELKTLIFPFIQKSSTLQEDAFEANEEVYDQANKAQEEYQSAHKQHVGN